eukprot:TRINITY_DN429_c1_g1_i4.p1 TRINITY_DN429_c1_g1~~TRINITY_DN429_c1_g1_i4.p1  ORF type:complete len:104 (-),score=10.66 TRINITY_DN429_c1_g1_i4:151-462(-)
MYSAGIKRACDIKATSSMHFSVNTPIVFKPSRDDLLSVVAVTWTLSHITTVRPVSCQILEFSCTGTSAENKSMVEISNRSCDNFETFLTVWSSNLTSVVEGSL